MSPHRRGHAVLLFGLAACSDPVGPGLPGDAVPLTVRPIQYATWWRQTEACSGLRGDLDAVRWYAAGGGAFTVGGGTQEYDGYWFGDGNRIVLAAGKVDNGSTVRHEMLHALLRSGAHPPEYFVGRCGALAPCASECRPPEADRGVPASARQIPSESLTVALSLAPAGAPALSVDSGWVTVVVTATNARAEPVWVRVPGDRTFGYVLAGIPGTYSVSAEPRWAFRAGESRSLAFDCQLPAATSDTLWAFFGDAYTPATAVRVGP